MNHERVVFSLHNFLKFFGIAGFSCEGVNLVLPIRNKMKNPRKFTKYLLNITIADIIYTVILGVLAYFILGDSIEPLIFENYFKGKGQSGLLFYLIVLYAICLYINMPYFFYPVIQIFEEKGWVTKIFKVNFISLQKFNKKPEIL